MATVWELRERVRELEYENETLEQECEDLKDTLGRISELATSEEPESEDGEAEDEGE